MGEQADDPMWLNVGCGPWRAESPWVNLDVHQGDGVHPDIIVEAERPCAGWRDQTVERVYLGHVLEHVPWDELAGFLADLRRVLVPEGEVCVVGPDVLRSILGWHDGSETWDLVVSTLEGPDYFPADGGHRMVEAGSGWRYARHWWNCTEQRVVKLLEDQGFSGVRGVPIASGDLDGWPLVGRAPWQMAVLARK